MTAKSRVFLKGGQKIIKQPAAVSAAVLRHEAAPQLRLPQLFAIIFIAELSLLPGCEHLGPVNGILVKKICDAAGQLVEFKACVALQIGFRAWQVDMGQQAHNAPGKGFALESRSVGPVRQTRLHSLRKECIGEGKNAVGADAQLPGQVQRQPPRHAPALHHDHLRLKGRGRRYARDFGKRASQYVQLVAGMQIERHGGHYAMGATQAQADYASEKYRPAVGSQRLHKILVWA